MGKTECKSHKISFNTFFPISYDSTIISKTFFKWASLLDSHYQLAVMAYRDLKRSSRYYGQEKIHFKLKLRGD